MTYEQKIKSLNITKDFSKETLMNEDFIIYKDDKIDILYAPFDYINRNAKVVIVGITPGWTQMNLSYNIVNKALRENESWDSSLEKVKKGASFAGSMRTYLIEMLDEIGLNNKLNIKSTESLFDEHNSLLHSTSYLKYPVFSKGENYRGSNPNPLKSPLWDKIVENFVPEINCFENTLIIPLGKSVKKVFSKLIADKKISPNIYLEHFPHPSGANGHRQKQFDSSKDLMRKQIAEWKY